MTSFQLILLENIYALQEKVDKWWNPFWQKFIKEILCRFEMLEKTNSVSFHHIWRKFRGEIPMQFSCLNFQHSTKMFLLMSWAQNKLLENHPPLRGHREGGRLGSVKNFKTPFFKGYWKFLSWGYFYRSRTSPFFFLFRISQQIHLLEPS